MLYNVAVLIKARLSFANSVESSGNHVWVLAKYLLRQPGVHQASEASEGGCDAQYRQQNSDVEDVLFPYMDF